MRNRRATVIFHYVATHDTEKALPWSARGVLKNGVLHYPAHHVGYECIGRGFPMF